MLAVTTWPSAGALPLAYPKLKLPPPHSLLALAQDACPIKQSVLSSALTQTLDSALAQVLDSTLTLSLQTQAQLQLNQAPAPAPY